MSLRYHSVDRPTSRTRGVDVPEPGATATRILAAARSRLLADGYAALSTRRVAEEAGVPLSQIHYHFGGKQGLVLELLEYENQPPGRPPTGDVRRRGPAVAAVRAGVRSPRRGPALRVRPGAAGDDRRRLVGAGAGASGGAHAAVVVRTCWSRSPARREDPVRRPGLFSAEDVAALVELAFLGGEAVILLGDEEWGRRARTALRGIATLIRQREESTVE